MENNEAGNKNENKKPPSVPEKINAVADDEAITEIDLNDFLIENSKETPLFAGFREDIDKTEKSLEDELRNLYDDIVSAGPETIVPKPLSVLASNDADAPGADGNGFDDVSRVSSDETGEEEKIAGAAPAISEADGKKDDIFGMIETLKAENEAETGFDEILSEIESNEEIAPVEDEFSAAAGSLCSGGSTADRAAYGAEEGLERDADPDEKFSSGDLDEELKKLLNESESSSLSEGLAEEIPDGFLDGESAGDLENASEKNKFAADGSGEGRVRGAPPGKLYEADPMCLNVLEEEVYPEEDGKNKKSRGKKKTGSDGNAGSENDRKKKIGSGEIVRRIVLTLSIITIILSCGVLVNAYLIEPFRFKTSEEDLVRQMKENISLHSDARVSPKDAQNDAPKVKFPEGMLAKYAQLYAVNQDLSGWISIPGLDINLPIAKGDDNKYYTKRDIYRKYTNYGVSFFDYRIKDLKNLHKNTVVYGHNMRRDDYIFGMLENYREIKGGFAQSPVIECNTIYGDHFWFVYAVFISNSKRSQDNGYLFPYNFIDASDAKFADYIKEIDKRKLYTTGVDIDKTDKILTLSTCCYDFEEARLVVVARERRAGESLNVDVSKAFYNENPKYPQIWYDVNKKTNPYAEDPRW